MTSEQYRRNLFCDFMPLDIVTDVLCCKFCEDLSRNATKKLFPEKLENNLQTMCTILVYAHVFVYCRQDNDVMLTSDNRVSRLSGPNGACPDVTRLSGIYCIMKRNAVCVCFNSFETSQVKHQN